MASRSSLLYKRGGRDDGGEWDDSKLIEAYDKAMLAAKERAKKKAIMAMNGRIKTSKKGKWKVGDFCQALFPEDGLLYEAQIMHVDEANGVCVVQYLGYGNEEEVGLDDLTRSQGKSARERQVKAVQDQSAIKWEVGDLCRARYSEDGLMYDAVILATYDDEESFLVRYNGYENEEVVSRKDLEPFLGTDPKRESESASGTASQHDISVVDEVSSTYSSEPSSLTASENEPTPSRRRHSHIPKPEVPFECSGDRHRPRRSSSHDHPRNSPYERSFLPNQHLPLPMNGEGADFTDDLGSMLIAWYMAGYHTGYYQGKHAARSELEDRSRRYHDHH